VSAVPQLSLRWIVLLIAASVPLALGIEAAIRNYLFLPLMGAELQELREFYWPALTDELRRATLTQIAWALVGATSLAGTLGVALLRRTAERERDLAKIRDRLLLLTSIPQVPAILATLCFAFGSSLLPVSICIALSTAFVLAQGLIGERLLTRPA
jgi:hypothetical protein